MLKRPEPVVFHHRVGKSRAGLRSRIWLEGDRLFLSGWRCGDRVRRDWDSDRLVLTWITSAEYERLPNDRRSSVAGTKDRPIIDIVGRTVQLAFGELERVRVVYGFRRIEIRRD